MKFLIGTLNKRLEIQHPTHVASDYNEQVASYVTTRTVWAAIWPLSGKQTLEAMQAENTATHKIRIRYYPGFKPNVRLKYQHHFYEVVSMVDLDMAHRVIEIMAKEIIE